MSYASKRIVFNRPELGLNQNGFSKYNFGHNYVVISILIFSVKNNHMNNLSGFYDNCYEYA